MFAESIESASKLRSLPLRSVFVHHSVLSNWSEEVASETGGHTRNRNKT